MLVMIMLIVIIIIIIIIIITATRGIAYQIESLLADTTSCIQKNTAQLVVSRQSALPVG